MTYKTDMLEIVSKAVPDVVVYDRWEQFVNDQQPRCYMEYLSSIPDGMRVRDRWRAHFIPAVPHAQRLMWALGHPYYQGLIREKDFDRIIALQSGASVLPEEYAYGVVDRAVVPLQVDYGYDFRIDFDDFDEVEVRLRTADDSFTFTVDADS